MDTFIDILMAMEEGGKSTQEIAEMLGRAIPQTHKELVTMREAGFLAIQKGESYDHDQWTMTTKGKKLLANGFDEYFKKVLAENWGGKEDSAS